LDLSKPSKRKLLITGGSGLIGTILTNALNEKYEITILDLKAPQNSENIKFVVGDITKLDRIEKVFSNIDVVIHLGADVSMQADWSSVYSKNILGTYNVFEASRRADVRKIVFASSNHVTGLYEKDWPISSIVKGDYAGLDRSTIPKISNLSPQRADSFYGTSKLFGEGLGQYYSSEFGISIICLRIGTVQPHEWPMASEKRYFATWLSHCDLIQLIEKSIEAQEVKFDVFYGVSNNTWRFWDISHAKDVIGYDPQDDAELHH